jgi:chorismate mutase
MLHHNIDTLQNDIHSLFNERYSLQQFVSRFKNSNEKYLQIKDVAEEHVNRLLTEQESLLDLALKAVIEALRMDPDRYAIIYNSEYDSDAMYIIVAVLQLHQYHLPVLPILLLVNPIKIIIMINTMKDL